MNYVGIPSPIYLNEKDEDFIFKFVIHGRPWVQKNNLNIFQIPTKTGKRRTIIDHTAKLKSTRNQISLDIYKQYINYKFKHPIDYYIEMRMVFFIERRSEPDLDNLPAILLDAMQGFSPTKGLDRIAITLTDDKLLRKETSEKIVKGDKLYYGEPRSEVVIRRYHV